MFVPVAKLVRSESMLLSSVVFDGKAGCHRADPAADTEGLALSKRSEKTGAVGVACSGGVFNGQDRTGGDVFSPGFGDNSRSFFTKCDDHDLNVMEQLLGVPTGFFLKKFYLVVISNQIFRLPDRAHEFLWSEGGDLLTRVKYDRDRSLGALLCMFESDFLFCGRQNCKFDMFSNIGNSHRVINQCTGIKCSNLVVVFVSRDMC